MLYFWKAWDSRILNMTFPCIKCETHKYANTQIHKYKVLKRPNMCYIIYYINIYKLTERPVVLLNAIFLTFPVRLMWDFRLPSLSVDKDLCVRGSIGWVFVQQILTLILHHLRGHQPEQHRHDHHHHDQNHSHKNPTSSDVMRNVSNF